MSDVLSSASLLLTIAAVFIGLWYNEIENAIQAELPLHAADRKPEIKTIRDVLYRKSLPLTILVSVHFTVFLPDTLAIIWHSLRSALTDFPMAILSYNSVEAAFVLVEILSLSLALILWKKTYSLKEKVRKG